MARSMAFEDLATVVYVWVDDWYQAHAADGRQGLAGAKPLFSDSEVITLLLPVDFLPFPGETQFLGFVRANHRALFPQLLSQSQFNRRARQLGPGGRDPAPALGGGVGGHPRLPLSAGHQAAARGRLHAPQGPQRLCDHGRLRGLCQPPPEVFRVQAGPALHAGGRARGLRPGAGLDGRAGRGGAGPGPGPGGPHPRRQGLYRGRLAAGLPGDPGPGDPDPGAPQPAPGPPRSSGGSTGCGNGSKAPSTRCRTPAATWNT